MTIKELAYSAQQQLSTTTDGPIKRSHVYELLAASFGFNSYAAFLVEAAFCQRASAGEPSSVSVQSIAQRCAVLGYPTEAVAGMSAALYGWIEEQQLQAVRIADIAIALIPDEESDERFLDGDESVLMVELPGSTQSCANILLNDLLLNELRGAASNDNPHAHYALALLHAPKEGANKQSAGIGYWYFQAQAGKVLAGFAKECADSYASQLERQSAYERHLRQAATLGLPEALFDLADRFDEPSFFEQASQQVSADPASVAAVAERLGRPQDAKEWLTRAAESGDTEAMRELIEGHDANDPLRCWTWLYLAELLGEDLTRDDFYAINERGGLYDDDVGGPAYVAGREGIRLAPLKTSQAAGARRQAEALYSHINET